MRYDPKFPAPDEGFVLDMTRIGAFVPYEGSDRSLIYAPIQNPLSVVPSRVNRTHRRSAHISVPLDLVGKVPEHTLKGVGDRIPDGFTHIYVPSDDIGVRRFIGFQLAEHVTHNVDVALELKQEYEKALGEGDPVVLAAKKEGYDEAPTIRYGCVLRPQQVMLRVSSQAERKSYADIMGDSLDKEERDRMLKGKRPLEPVNVKAYMRLVFSLVRRADLDLISYFEGVQSGVEDNWGLDAERAADLELVRWAGLRHQHKISVNVVDGIRKFTNIKDGKPLTAGEGAELIAGRLKVLDAESGAAEDLVVFGYSVPLQVRLSELPREPPKDDEERLALAKTMKWYGVELKFDEGGKPTVEKGGLDRVMEKFSAGIALGYHLVANRLNGCFWEPTGSSLSSDNVLSCGYFVDPDTVHLGLKERLAFQWGVDVLTVGGLVKEMQGRLEGALGVECDKRPEHYTSRTYALTQEGAKYIERRNIASRRS